jgi:hypothetical protein
MWKVADSNSRFSAVLDFFLSEMYAALTKKNGYTAGYVHTNKTNTYIHTYTNPITSLFTKERI